MRENTERTGDKAWASWFEDGLCLWAFDIWDFGLSLLEMLSSGTWGDWPERKDEKTKRRRENAPGASKSY